MTTTINSNNESDYNTQSTDLFNLLPQPYRSDTNKSVMSNLFNRYLSTDETVQVIGYVGDGNANAVFIRKIVEPTVHRAGWQLQPLLYTKIGSIEYITSWYDILDELTAQGIDIDNLPVWGNATIYNFVPPIDINKIVNFQDYYWYDTMSPNSQPQYITVKSVCAQATALVTFYQNLISQFGATFNILQILPSINGIFVEGNQTLLFDPGFIFFIQNSLNLQLNNTFQTVVSSSYDSITNLTTIIINETITSNASGGQITLNEQLTIYQNLQSCECANISGWDIQPWDDNQANTPPPIWNVAVLADISYPTLTAWNVNHPIPQLNDIWYDTTNDILWSLQKANGASNLANWKDVYNNFSLILIQTTGTAYWDLSTGCAGSQVTISGLMQWIAQNKWVHKTDVQNFTIAKRAQAPIIEFEPQLELNEWTNTTFDWQYRSSGLVPFLSITTQPTRIELEPFNLYTTVPIGGNQFILDERFGDVTNIFVPGFAFTVAAYNLPFVVQSSTYQQSTLPSGAFQTRIVITTLSPVVLNSTVNYLMPEKTSMGDSFKGYGQQWLFNGINTTTAINHQPENTMDDPSGAPAIIDSSGNFTYQLAPYAEQFNMLVNGVSTLTLSTTLSFGSTRSLQQRSLVGFNDIRVYLNGVRQYGSYDEIGTSFVIGITFHHSLVTADVVLICVGEAAMSDFGNYAVNVRTVANDAQYAEFGNTLISLVQLRKAEQIKTNANQYPLFDIYLTNSNTAAIANEIFAYHDDSSGILYPYLSQRVVTRPDGSLEFVNKLVQTKNGLMYAYRNYNHSKNLYWYNPSTQILLIWNGLTWSSKYQASGFYTTPLILSALPDPATTPLGFLVFNTSTNTLYIRANVPDFWTVEISVVISTSDQTLETVWRHGLNNEQAIPARQDWLRRSFSKYETQHNQFVTTTSQQLIIANPSLTPIEATAQAEAQWTEIQLRSINPAWYNVPGTEREPPLTGLWCGQWQVPDPMYYNVSHWDYQYVSTRDLLSHFQSIVDTQPLFPGFNGQPSANWTLITYTDINWGLGGTIHEYDNSFDTFLSAEYTNVVIPPSLFNFAQSEYENIIVTLGQLFQHNAVNLLTQTDTITILTPQVAAANFCILSYEENEAANLVYGDSTTFTQAVVTSTGTTPAKGIQNWIATLPYFGIVPKVVPTLDFDSDRNTNAVLHHDGHRASYSIPTITMNGLQTQIANTVDPRVVQLPPEKIGRISTNSPPATQAAFISQFSTHLRTGVYWLQSTTQTLYRMVAFVQTTAPPTSFAEQTYWWNTTGTGTLNVLQTLNGVSSWIPLTASLTPAWQPVNLSRIYAELVLQAETMLYQNVPSAPLTSPINFVALQLANPTVWNQLLLQQFNNFVREAQITSPFANNIFDPTNPFTWNYKYSTRSQDPRSGVILSGGAWQDVYQKTYYTPYPHIEPWTLQGWSSEPTWWNTTFKNDNNLLYGSRRWKYIHNLPIVAVGSNVVTINVGSGNPQNPFIQKVFEDFNQFTIFTNTTHFTYNVQSVSFVGGNTVVTTTTPIDSSVTNSATISIGLWDYILRGATPNNQTPPITIPPTYSYVSVNISSTQTFIDGSETYESDDLFPPYWNQSAHTFQLTLPQDIYIRSIFKDTSVEVISENADYVFGDAGPIEWQWRDSTFYSYSLLTIAYLLQPVRTIQAIFGTVFEYIDGLPIDSSTGQVFSHENTNFHGEISTSNQLIKINGINQWYINYLRAHGFDSSYSNFRTMWTDWTAHLSHQFDATIDTSSFQIDHRVLEISPSDYELTMKKSPAVSNNWIDAFNVQIVSMPPIQSLFDSESQWILNVDSLAPITRSINYYDVKLYDYYVNPTTSVCSLFTYPIVVANITESSFIVAGDVSAVFGGDSGALQFVVTGSVANNGTYTVVSATFDPIAMQTTLIVSSSVASTIVGGLLSAINYRTLPWTTGDLVAVTTTEIAPLPLDISKQYFIIVLSSTTFQLALNQIDVVANIPIVFTSSAYGIQRVGQLYNTFIALNGQNTPTVWKHYAIDTSVVKKFTTPYQLTGMQNWINILDGYSAYIADQGFGVNVDGSYIDPQTGQHVSWQNEIERFINWSYIQRKVRRQRINDKYPVNVNYQLGQFQYSGQNPQFVVGSPIVVWAFGGGLPAPLISGQSYYIFNNNNNTVSLASTRTNALAGIPIQVTFSGTVGQLFLSAAALYLAEIPTYEINPFRNAIWYSPPDGIVSNVVTGPFADVTTQQLLFDQYGRKLASGDIRVFRQDKITQIQFAGGVHNDIIPIQNTQKNPYLYLHLGGGNIFVDTYEHVIIFNDYTSLGALIYDPFLGVNVTKFELDFYRQNILTERPNVGGYFLSTNFNQGGNIVRNIEATVTDLRFAYDTYQVPETLPIVQRARATLNYPGSVSYLQSINLTPKSQFLFWLGSLHAKGSVNAINAFINSRLFVSANVDQFWAYQVAQFGSSAEQEYLSLLLQTEDTITNDLRLEFISSEEICTPGYQMETFGDENCGYANPISGNQITFNTDPTFTPIVSTDTTRWLNQPEQLQMLQQDGGVLYFNLKPKQKLVIYPVIIGPTTFSPYGLSVVTDSTSSLFATNLTNEVAVIAFDPTNSTLEPSQQNPFTFWFWNSNNGAGFWEFGGGWNPTENELPILRHDFMADLVQITMNWYSSGFTTSYSIPSSPTNVLELNISPYLPLTNSLQIFEDGIQLQAGTDYVESLEPFGTSKILGFKLYFQESISGSTLNVVYGSSMLNPELQFQTINTNIVQLFSQEIITQMFSNNFTLTLWGLETDKQAQNPAKIIDELAQVVLAPVSFWDPARGFQYYQSLHSIDIQTNTDPAIYNSLDGWMQQELGKTWLDTTNVQYVPYYDPQVITDQNTRLATWGQLTAYGKPRIFQWVASPVAPADYNALAAAQENDSSIDPSIRLSGIARRDVRSRTRTNTTVIVTIPSAGRTLLIFNNVLITTDLTNLVSGTNYSFTITVNGILTRTINISGSQALTFGSLITTLNTQLAPLGASAALSGSEIIISSNTMGVNSTILIIEPISSGLFNSLTGFITQATIAGSGQSIQLASVLGFTVGQTVLFSSSGTLPTGLVSGTKYTIASISGNFIILKGITLSSLGTGTLLMVSSTFPTTWTIDQQMNCDLDPLIDAVSSGTVGDITTYTFNLENCVDPTQDYAIPLFVAGNTVNIYINGALNQSFTLATSGSPWPISLPMKQADRLTIILPIHTPTPAELAFDPTVADDGTVITQWQFITNYNAVQIVNTITNQQQFTYYFWVENVSTVPTNSTREPPINALADMIMPPQPYMFFNKLTPSVTTTNTQTGQVVILPDRFVQAIVHGLRGFVDSNNRYVLRFTRDFTLRDNLNVGTSPLQLKDTHQEWLMFRQAQLGNIPVDLWNKITESMVGFLLTDSSVRIPSLDRQLYDTSFGTSTRYGLGQDQAFVNGVLALATVQAYLNNPANNFSPINLDDFFSEFNFDTPQNIIAAMNAIYTTFSYINVNNIFFSILQDALTTQLQYAGLMKTSAISLYGVELLNIRGVFDD